MRLLSLSLLLLAFSCSHDTIKPSPPLSKEAFENPSDIVKVFKDYTKKIAGGRDCEPLKQGNHHELNNLDKFFAKDKIREIKLRKREIQANSFLFAGNGQADLRSRDTAIVNQWDGVCTSFGLTASIENSLGGKIQLSERHIWNRYRVYSIDAAIKAWDNSSSCITTQEKWPSSNSNPYYGYLAKENCHSFLVKTEYIADDMQKLITALDQGKSAYIGLSVTNSLYNCDAVVNPNSTETGGGHAVAIVGYKLDPSLAGGGYFIIKNSWGPTCGDKGYQYLNFAQCQRSDLYCLIYVIEATKT